MSQVRKIVFHYNYTGFCPEREREREVEDVILAKAEAALRAGRQSGKMVAEGEALSDRRARGERERRCQLKRWLLREKERMRTMRENEGERKWRIGNLFTASEN